MGEDQRRGSVMAEALCKWRGLAPWVAVVLTVTIQIAALSYSYGALSQRQNDFEHRLSVVETNDREQAKQLGDAASRLARIESGVDWLRQAAIQQGKGR